MAKFTGLDALALLALADIVCVIDDVSGTPVSKKITVENFWKAIDVLNAEASPAIDDLVAVYDTGESTTDKMTLANLLSVVDGLTAITSGIAAADTLLLLDGGTAKKVTTANLAAGTDRYVQAVVFDFTTENSTGDGKYYIHIPPALNGLNLTYVHAEVITAGTTGTETIQIHNLTQTADMLSTEITIDTGETGSDTAATPPVIDEAEDDVATNDVIRIDIDGVHTTAAEGLVVTLGFGL